jgi:hypothetical protein
MRTRPGEQVAFRNHPDVLWIEKETQRIAVAKPRFLLKSNFHFVGLDKSPSRKEPHPTDFRSVYFSQTY